MGEFNDWQLMGEKTMLQAKKEYSNLAKSKIFVASEIDFSAQIFEKIAYLKSLLPVLYWHNKNKDVEMVLRGIESEIDGQSKKIRTILQMPTRVLECQSVETKIFCNNLKLSAMTCLEIVDLVAKMQANCQELSQVVDGFCEICQKYISLFGDCEYRVFVKKYEK